MNHGGIEYRSASNSLEGALEKREKEIIRGTDPFSTKRILCFPLFSNFMDQIRMYAFFPGGAREALPRHLAGRG
jgi:hypothetical protein